MNIREFQGLMKQMYLHRDSERGAVATYNWLVDEVNELGAALKKGGERALRDEFADVLAWLASLANVLGIDLETAAVSKYDRKCPRCLQTKCDCPPE